MIPYGDDVGGSRKAWITPLLIIGMTAVFAGEWVGWIDYRILALYPEQFLQKPFSNLYRLVTSEFLHADIFHLGFNMCFLYAFGRTVEKILGGFLYVVVFLFLGAFGGLFHVMLFSTSTLPELGASGSISAIMGLYLVLAYWAKVKTFFAYLPTLAGFTALKCQLPSWIILVYFIIMQLFNMYMGEIGVANDVHIICFIVGLISGYFLLRSEKVQDHLDDIHNNPVHLDF